MFPSQGLDEQLLPLVHTGFVMGPIKLRVQLGFSPTLQDQGGVELRTDGVVRQGL